MDGDPTAVKSASRSSSERMRSGCGETLPVAFIVSLAGLVNPACAVATLTVYHLPRQDLMVHNMTEIQREPGHLAGFLIVEPVGVAPMWLRCGTVWRHSGDRVVRAGVKPGPFWRLVIAAGALFETLPSALLLPGSIRRGEGVGVAASSIFLADGLTAAFLAIFLKTKPHTVDNTEEARQRFQSGPCPRDVVVEVGERRIPFDEQGRLDPIGEAWLLERVVLGTASLRIRIGARIVEVTPTQEDRCSWAKMHRHPKTEFLCVKPKAVVVSEPAPISGVDPVVLPLPRLPTIRVVIPIPAKTK